jgi:hypothetical protein
VRTTAVPFLIFSFISAMVFAISILLCKKQFSCQPPALIFAF